MVRSIRALEEPVCVTSIITYNFVTKEKKVRSEFMIYCTLRFFIVAVLLVIGAAACSNGEAQQNTNATVQSSASTSQPVVAATPVATPRNDFTPADVAKLKWIEGAWRGMDGDKPFYERYKIEPNAMIVESLKEDGSADGAPGRFELKNGEFGKGEGEVRTAASEITDTSVQFVPAGNGNSFRFVKRPHGWDAILEWPVKAGRLASSKTYTMEPWTAPKK